MKKICLPDSREIYAYFDHLLLINGSAKFQSREFPAYANLLISKHIISKHRRTANIFNIELRELFYKEH